jgi:hypothetical protein
LIALVSTAFEASMLPAAVVVVVVVAAGLSAGSLVFLEVPAAEGSLSSMRESASWPRRRPQHGRPRWPRAGRCSNPSGPTRWGTSRPRRAADGAIFRSLPAGHAARP